MAIGTFGPASPPNYANKLVLARDLRECTGQVVITASSTVYGLNALAVSGGLTGGIPANTDLCTIRPESGVSVRITEDGITNPSLTTPVGDLYTSSVAGLFSSWSERAYKTQMAIDSITNATTFVLYGRDATAEFVNTTKVRIDSDNTLVYSLVSYTYDGSNTTVVLSGSALSANNYYEPNDLRPLRNLLIVGNGKCQVHFYSLRQVG